MTEIEEARPRRSLTSRIVIGMAAGLILGVGLNMLRHGLDPEGLLERGLHGFLIDGLFYVVGAVFMASLKLLVVPLVFVSLVCGAASLDDISRLGRIGGKTLALYLATTAIAISVALSAAALFRPGDGLDLPTNLEFAPRAAPGWAETVVNIFPSNPVQAMAEGNMLQIIVFALLFGFAMSLSGDPGRRLLAVFEDLNKVVLRLVTVLMEIAPYGVFCLLARIFADQGLGAIAQLASYFSVVLAVLLFHGLVVYPMLLRIFSGLDPRVFLRKMRAPISFAFSTASSNATLPVTLETAEERLGVDNRVASFTIPLGATINMDGTAIMQGVATVFIAQAYGLDLGPAQYLGVVLTATLASIGTAGVPGVGLIMLALVLRQANLPVEGIALIIGVDRLLDMVRTAVNITGDAAVTCIVARSEGQLDAEAFQAP
ncbi:MAG: dicarboxylate/amino acid:cation symporter [Myxococcota bacterium]|nr:dicarboxylate/amino acid:cation symporter [Myxococcota bacterium]